MANKFGTVKNPLSVIAIFAGIAEISGAAVLPHISPENQQLYIWFLMTFPFALVVLFFITLNWNYKVLYAPSDFENEDNFVNLQKASFSETLLKLKDEVLEENNEELEGDTTTDKTESILGNAEIGKVVERAELKLEIGQFSTKSEREEQRQIARQLNRLRMREERAVERLLIDRIQSELRVTVERDMKFESFGRRMVFDGVIRNGNNLTAIEARRLNRNTVPMSYWMNVHRRYNDFYSSLSDSEKSDFSMIYSVATEDDVTELTSFLEKKLSKLSFPVVIKVYDFDEVVGTAIQEPS